MATTQPTFGEIINDIKVESKNYGNNELDSWIKTVINEIQTSYTALVQYPQLLVADQQLNLTTNTEAVTLPTNLQHCKLDTVKYYNGMQGVRRFLNQFDKFQQTTFGWPAQVRRQGNQLLITPYVNIATGDYIVFDYYKLPDVLVNDADVFPIPELIPVIKKAVIARATAFSDPKKYAVMKAEERQSYIASQAIT